MLEKVVQITVHSESKDVFALTDQGRMFQFASNRKWYLLPPIPEVEQSNKEQKALVESRVPLKSATPSSPPGTPYLPN